jgi:taurine dioxygenase
MPGSRLKIRPVTGYLGAEITGVDLARLDDATFAEIRRALLNHIVLAFRDQHLTPETMNAFARRFGPLTDQYEKPRAFERMKDHPEIMEVIKEKEDRGITFGNTWHFDVTFWEKPIFGNVIYFRDIPEAGGDTMFSNQYLAYESLSAAMRRWIDPLKAVHSSVLTDRAAWYTDRKTDLLAGHPAEGPLREGEVLHPLVRTHPKTGRKAIFLNRVYVHRLEGMTEEESRPLLDYLEKNALRPEFTCRMRWEKNTVGMWDNRCAQHYAVNDYHGARRHMWRISIAGDRPV